MTTPRHMTPRRPLNPVAVALILAGAFVAGATVAGVMWG